MNLFDFYKTHVPIWEKAYLNELVELARNDYPDAKCMDEAIFLADKFNNKSEDIVYHLGCLAIWLNTTLFSKTKKKFRLRYFPDWQRPEVLAFDAKLCMRKGKSVDQVKDSHRIVVEAVTHFKIWARAMNYWLSKEAYGRNVIDLVIGKNPKALNHLFNMLNVKSHVGRHGSNSQDDIESEAGKLICSAVEKSKKDAPYLVSFLPDELPLKIRKKMTRLIRGRKIPEAKLISDSIAGVFRTLPQHFKCDSKNYGEYLQTKKQKFYNSAIRIDEVVENKSQDIPNNVDMESTFETESTIKILSRELEKPEYTKLKLVFEELRKNPDISNSDLAKLCGIHRNTVPQRKKELEKIINSITI